MAKYKECPNCGNCEDGTIIYKCIECDGFFCSDIDCRGNNSAADEIGNVLTTIFSIGVVGDTTVCPHCGVSGFHKEKYTITDDDDNDDDD